MQQAGQTPRLLVFWEWLQRRLVWREDFCLCGFGGNVFVHSAALPHRLAGLEGALKLTQLSQPGAAPALGAFLCGCRDVHNAISSGAAPL